MPNPWSKLKQQAYECFNGPRTVDYEFGQKVEEVKIFQEKLHQIKSLILTFTERTMGLKAMWMEIYNSFGLPFPNDCPYGGFGQDVVKVHRALENSYSICSNAMKRLQEDISKWDAPFKDLHDELKKRDETRRIYDHYDTKMSELVKKRNDKLLKGKSETNDEMEKFERNEIKYREAANNFIKQSNLTYEKMQILLDGRFLMLAPTICDFIENERIFFNQSANYLNYFKDAKGKVDKLRVYNKKTPIYYDCKKFLRGACILGGIDTGKEHFVEAGKIGGGNIYQPKTNYQQINNYPSGRPGYPGQGGQPRGGQGGGMSNPYPNMNNPYQNININSNQPKYNQGQNSYQPRPNQNNYSQNPPNQNPYGPNQNMGNQNPYANNQNMGNQNPQNIPNHPHNNDFPTGNQGDFNNKGFPQEGNFNENPFSQNIPQPNKNDGFPNESPNNPNYGQNNFQNDFPSQSNIQNYDKPTTEGNFNNDFSNTQNDQPPKNNEDFSDEYPSANSKAQDAKDMNDFLGSEIGNFDDNDLSKKKSNYLYPTESVLKRDAQNNFEGEALDQNNPQGGEEFKDNQLEGGNANYPNMNENKPTNEDKRFEEDFPQAEGQNFDDFPKAEGQNFDDFPQEEEKKDE
ncbi:MAG: hypothetical protein MJ252_01135 [archaeon]|nr:hypothetical protein [archaeon]